MAAFPDSIRRYAIHRLSRLAHTRWDVFHRTIRDIKLSLPYACKGAFLQVQMRSNYLWGLAYRPYGTGHFMQHKTRLLDVMLQRESQKLATFFTQCLSTYDGIWGANSSMEEAWSERSSCSTFHCKGTMPKLGRWFAWNDAAEEQLSEFNVLKLVLAYHYKHEKKNHWIQMHRQSGGPFQKLPNWQPVVMGRKQTCERSSALWRRHWEVAPNWPSSWWAKNSLAFAAFYRLARSQFGLSTVPKWRTLWTTVIAWPGQSICNPCGGVSSICRNLPVFPFREIPRWWDSSLKRTCGTQVTSVCIWSFISFREEHGRLFSTLCLRNVMPAFSVRIWFCGRTTPCHVMIQTDVVTVVTDSDLH